MLGIQVAVKYKKLPVDYQLSQKKIVTLYNNFNFLSYICNRYLTIVKDNLKIFILCLGFVSLSSFAIADRGGKKPTSRVMLNIGSNSALKGSIFSKYSNGLRYTGSAILNTTLNGGNNSFEKTTITTFQKGNTIYIQPYRQAVIVPEIKQGYTGMKLIIKPY